MSVEAVREDAVCASSPVSSTCVGRRARVRACVAPVRGTSARGCRTVRLQGREMLSFRIPVQVRSGTKAGRRQVAVSMVLPGRGAVRARGVLVVQA